MGGRIWSGRGEGMIKGHMTYLCLHTILTIMDHSHYGEYIKRFDRCDSYDSSYCWRPSHLLGCNISNKSMKRLYESIYKKHNTAGWGGCPGTKF